MGGEREGKERSGRERDRGREKGGRLSLRFTKKRARKKEMEGERKRGFIYLEMIKSDFRRDILSQEAQELRNPGHPGMLGTMHHEPQWAISGHSYLPSPSPRA